MGTETITSLLKFDISALTITVMALLGAVCTILVNQGIAVFHDGLRPIMPQHLQGTMKRGEIVATSFALSFGLAVGFGLTTSIANGIILIHALLLATDVIGLCFKPSKSGMLLAGLAGAVFGVALMFGMSAIMQFFSKLPINFLPHLAAVGDPVIVAFTFFPALAIGYQHGFKKGAIAFILTVLAQQFIKLHGVFIIPAGEYGLVKEMKISLNAEGMALLVGLAAMIIMAIKDKRAEGGEIADTMAIFGNNIKNIQKNWHWLMLSGGLSALACSLFLIAEGPQSIVLMSKSIGADGLIDGGMINEATIIALARALGFIPLVMLTAIVGGVYSPEGTKLVFVPAILFITMGTTGLILSFFVGAAILGAEVFLLRYVAIGLDKFPGVKDMGDHIRTSMTRVLEVALLLGGFLAAAKIAPNFGVLWVMGVYLLNKTSKRAITEMAIGPLAAITLGIFVNILHYIGMFPIPVVK